MTVRILHAKNYLKRHHLLPLVGYLILASFTGFAFAQERTHSNQNRASLAAQTKQNARALAIQTHKTQLAGCARTNDLRNTVAGILVASEGTLKLSVKNHTITPERAAEAKQFYDAQIKKLAPVNCAKVYPIIQVK